MLAALEAAEGAGGDIRGRQSAAMLIVKGESSGRPWADRVLELRVEDHAEPLAELARLLTVHRAYEHMNAGDVAVEHGDLERAMAEYGRAAELLPDNVEVQYWAAVTLATSGDLVGATPMFERVFAQDPSWVELTRRLTKPGIIPDTPEGEALVERIVALAE
jgi:tetratricopeptide (TPR) repeat protein